MRRKKTVVILGTVAVLLLPIILFRIPGGRTQIRTEEVRFRYIDPGTSVRRTFEENFAGRRHVSLASGQEIYVTARERDDTWSLLRASNQKVLVRFEAQPLLFGGIGPARIKNLETRPGKPLVVK